MKCIESLLEPPLDLSWAGHLRRVVDWQAGDFPHLAKTTPNLAYGRHDGPTYPKVRRAANLILVYQHPTLGWAIPLMKRAEREGIHAGEIALPGGRCELDESDQAAALREFREETGHSIAKDAILGELPATNVWASNHQVRTFVATSMSLPTWNPDPKEVAVLFHLPISQLQDPRNFGMHQVTRRRVQFSAPHLRVDGQRVWGATLRMLVELGQALNSAC